MSAPLQEAQFACFEEEEFTNDGDFSTGHAIGSSSSIRTVTIAFPAGVRSPPAKSFARVRSLECSGSGSFYFQNEALKDRFVCWRVIKNIVVLREWSLHETLADNGIRLLFPVPVVATGVYVVESWEDNAVMIGVTTHAGTIHRFTYMVPAKESQSIFTKVDNSFPPKPSARSQWDVVTSLAPDEIITVAMWVNEYNLVLGADSGRIIGVNFGLPTSSTSSDTQEFVFSDESVVKWLWSGVVKSSMKWQSDDNKRQTTAIMAMTCFPIESEEEESDDICVITISADFMLRAWSYGSQSCMGKQHIRSLLNIPGDDDNADAYVVQAKIVALTSTSAGSCRLLVHVDTTANYSQEIYLLRGDIEASHASGRVELELDAARVFTVDSAAIGGKRLKMVDFAVDKNYLYSSWRSSNGDFIYSHSNPMALTGPRLVQGTPVSSLNAQMLRYSAEDDEWPFDLKEEAIETSIDNFFAVRILLPGRFSRQNLYKAVVEYHGDLEVSLRPFIAHTGQQQSKYKDLLVKIVSEKWMALAGRGRQSNQDPNIIRIGIWKTIIDLCNKHWRVENVPVGFALTTNTLLPGAPVVLRRNRVSLLFPAPSAITATFLTKGNSASAECVRDLVAEILPVFDAFPSQSFQSFIHGEVTDVISDWKVESFVALARHCVRLGMKPEFVPSDSIDSHVSAEIILTRATLHLSKILGVDPAFHEQVLNDLIEHLFPFELAKDSKAVSPARSNASYDDEDDDYVMEDGASSLSSSTTKNLFRGREICFAFDQIASRTVDEMCTQALRVVLFLSYLTDSQPAFLNPGALQKVTQVYLPRAITIYQRWCLSKWISNQNIIQASEADSASAKTSATLMPPLLQLFLMDANSQLNKTNAFKRARSVLQLALMNKSVRSEEAHNVLGTFTREILQYISQPNDRLVEFLQKRKQFAVLRAMFCCGLSDISLHGINYEHPHQHHEVQQYVRAIGECLAREGHATARVETKEHAKWCFHQAIRCFSICLSSFLSGTSGLSMDGIISEKVAERFIYDVVALLKETIPRGYFDQMLEFLWAIVTQTLNQTEDIDHALQSFIWVNVFKYSVEERLFRDAHFALTHLVELAALTSSVTMTDDDGKSEAVSTAGECMNYLVKELLRYGHLDLICELQWGTLATDVEKQIQWYAANANVLKDGGTTIDPAVITYYNLLFAFYLRKQEPANAAASMYSLALRLRLAPTKSKAALQAQRNALYAAQNALLALPKPNQWIVRKYHTEELISSSSMLLQTKDAASQPPLSIVTLQDIERDIAILDGKLRLLHLGLEESVLLNTMGGEEVVALLIDALYSVSSPSALGTAAEKRQEALVAVELASEISAKSHFGYSNMTKSIARYCVSSTSASLLCWEMLEVFLTTIDSLEQYMIAAETILEWKVKFVLPEWLYSRLADRTTGNPAKLLKLYVQHGLLLEALKLAEDVIPEELLQENESAFTQRANTPRDVSLPWIPYNIFDTVLDSADALLQARGLQLTEKEVLLREGLNRVREKLMSYFRYINVLEQARTAADTSKTSVVGDSGFRFS